MRPWPAPGTQDRRPDPGDRGGDAGAADQGPAPRLRHHHRRPVTGDSQQATIFYTVLGEDEELAGTAAALESAKGLIRSEVGKQLGMRHVPTLTFIADALPETARHLDELLAQARKAHDEAVAAAARRDVRRRGRPVQEAPRGRRGRRPRRRAARAPPRRPRRTRERRRPRADGPGRRRQAGRADLARRRGAGPARPSAPARSATPAPSTRWRRGCSCSASDGPPGCSDT